MIINNTIALCTNKKYNRDVRDFYAKYLAVLGRLDKGIQYRVKVPRAETLFLAMESRIETESRLCGWYKGFVLNVLDQCGETAFIIRKDPSLLHVPCSRQVSRRRRIVRIPAIILDLITGSLLAS